MLLCCCTAAVKLLGSGMPGAFVVYDCTPQMHGRKWANKLACNQSAS